MNQIILERCVRDLVNAKSEEDVSWIVALSWPDVPAKFPVSENLDFSRAFEDQVEAQRLMDLQDWTWLDKAD
jgi:hypothetical protein